MICLFPHFVMEDFNSVPHGSRLYSVHWNCECDVCGPKRFAIRELVISFSHIPARWIEELAASHDEFLPLPMWDTLFVPIKPPDVENIKRLLVEMEVDDDEHELLARGGWREIADTGVLAREFDGELLLGIHGAGYDFWGAHWSRLYDALGYQWHLSDEI